MRAPITTLLLLLLLAVAWLVLRQPDEPPVAPPVSGPQAATDGQDPAPVAADLPDDAPRVRLRVTERASLSAPMIAPFQVTRGGVATAEPVTVLAGSGAGAWTPDMREGRSLVAIDRADGRRLHRIVAFAADGPNPIETGLPVTLRGRVTDAGGQPIANATVDAGESGKDGLDSVTTDADGAFALTVIASPGVPVVARAEGYAAAHRLCEARGDVGDLQLTLVPECRVEVQLAAVARELALATVFVLAGDEPTTELLRVPLFLQARDHGVAVDAQGRCVLRGLPQGATVRLLVHHPWLPLTPPVAVVLQGAVTSATLPLAPVPAGEVATMAGRVLDEAGLPVGGAMIVLATGASRDDQAGRRLLPPFLDAIGAAVAFSDAEGRFRVGVPHAARQLSVRAPGLCGLDREAGAAPEIGDLVLPAWSGPPFELRVPPPVPGRAWGILVEPATTFTAVAAGQPFVLRFEQACIADVAVADMRGGAGPTWREATGLPITGAIDLPADLRR